jgi:hypothetical protein
LVPPYEGGSDRIKPKETGLHNHPLPFVRGDRRGILLTPLSTGYSLYNRFVVFLLMIILLYNETK